MILIIKVILILWVLTGVIFSLYMLSTKQIQEIMDEGPWLETTFAILAVIFTSPLWLFAIIVKLARTEDEFDDQD